MPKLWAQVAANDALLILHHQGFSSSIREPQNEVFQFIETWLRGEAWSLGGSLGLTGCSLNQFRERRSPAISRPPRQKRRACHFRGAYEESRQPRRLPECFEYERRASRRGLERSCGEYRQLRRRRRGGHGSAWAIPDLVIGSIIGLIVLCGAVLILKIAR